MKRILIVLGAALLALPLAAQEQLYGGIGRGSAINPGALVVIDQTTGIATVLADPIDPGGLTGLAFLPDGRLFGTTIEGFGTTSTLVQLDPDTGALIAVVGPVTAGAMGPAISIADLAVQPSTGLLFAIRANADGAGLGGELYTIDPTTAVATLIGDTGTGVGLGLAFTPDGMLYHTSGSQLDVLNPADASVITTIPFSLGISIDGLASRPSDGILFGTRTFPPSEEIYTIVPATGVMTLVGSTLAGHPSDLAFRPIQPIIEIPTLSHAGLLLLVLVLAGLGVVAMRRL
ncbi:MAG: IPTL-CTERM sorting domain-containing protein [Acidobacteria bacterium]|nr:MAG: IPTL-CTERM sorting domain-containing protein [Acidobacteriota bacterium]